MMRPTARRIQLCCFTGDTVRAMANETGHGVDLINAARPSKVLPASPTAKAATERSEYHVASDATWTRVAPEPKHRNEDATAHRLRSSSASHLDLTSASARPTGTPDASSA